MRAVYGIVLICVVNVVLGHEDHGDATCTSPIDVNPNAATCEGGGVRPVVNFGDSFNGVLANKNKYGSSILISIPEDAAAKMSVKIGDHDYSSAVTDYHFHWGKDATIAEGSEHTDNGKHHQMEMHFTTNLTHTAKIHAMTFFVDERDGEDNPAFVSLAQALKKIGEPGAISVDSNLKEMVGPAFDGAFYQYIGTPFVPPCDVVCLWTIFQTPLQISKSQMDAFRASRAAGDFSPIQPLNDRKLHDSSKSCKSE